MSGEHLFAAWIQKYVPPDYTAATFHSVRQWIGDDTHGVPFHHHHTGRLARNAYAGTQRLNIVCETCNNEWMGSIQAKSEPLLAPFIQGGWRSLTAKERETVAAWAIMTTMVGDYSDENLVAVPQSQRRRFLGLQGPLQDWFVWLGTYTGSDWKMNHFRTVVGLDHSSHVSTFVIGRLLLHVMASTRPDVLTLLGPYFANLGLWMIWPHSNGVGGDQATVSDAGIEWFRHRPREIIREALRQL